MTRRKRALDDLDQQIREHLEEEIQDNIARGMSPDEARRAARRKFGSVALVKEDARAVWVPVWCDQLRQDVRYGLRSLLRTPGFTAVAVLTLALGIGANTAIFSFVNGLLLRPLAVRDPERLVMVSGANWIDGPRRNLPVFMWSYPMWAQVRERPQLFDGSFGYFYSRFNLASAGETEFVDGFYASGGFFETLGVGAIRGRTLTDADDQRGGGAAGPVAVISYGLWQRRFSGAEDVLGRTLSVDRVPLTIVGVLPPTFTGLVAGRSPEIVIPIGVVSLVRGSSFLDHAGANWITIMARLKPDQTLEAATAALRGVQPQLREASLPPGSPSRVEAYLKSPLTLLPAGRGNPVDPIRERSQLPLLTMQAAVALVLLIACANIANLALARGIARRHETGIRLALGASRWRLLRQMFVESLLLASAGAIGGFLLAGSGTSLLVQYFSSGANTLALDLAPDGRVFAFTAAITVAASVLFGVIPAIRGSHVEPIQSLRAARGSVIGSRLHLASGLVVGQVALSLILVVGGGLLIRTYANLARMDLGFDPAGVLAVDVGTLKAQIPPANRLVVFEEVRRAVASVPGVGGTALADILPVAGGAMAGDFEVSGAPPARGGSQAYVNRVSPGWLSVYRTPVLNGRDFTDGDRSGSHRVTIVNQTFARQFLEGVNPLGRVVRQLQGPPGRSPMEWEIVGVTVDAVYDSLRAPVPPTMYLAFSQIDEDLLAAAPDSATLNVRAVSVPPMGLRQSVAAAIARVNPNLDLTFRSLPDVVSGSITLERILAILSGLFGVVSLLLAVVGLYGVTSYAISQRRTEIGIRIALGATPGLVIRQVLSRVLTLVGTGVVIGAGMSFWASQFAGMLLYGVQPRDPEILVGACVVLAAAGALAGWLPAWRASRVDPMVALRCE